MTLFGLVLLFLAALWAGLQNALAGGGAFILLPSLMFGGLDARAANITLTIALFPAQVATGWTGRKLASGAAGLSLGTLIVISLCGGALGAGLLLLTSAAFFAHLVPWLVLFATGLFAWGSFGPRPHAGLRLGRRGAALSQLAISVYGGYFGGGIGFLMLAVLTAARLVIRKAAATKNVLAAVMNASAVALFALSPQVRWRAAGVVGAGALLGGLAGVRMLQRVNERALQIAVVLIGTALTIGLFVHAG